MMDLRDDPGSGKLIIKTDQQHRKIVIAQLHIMPMVPRPFGDVVHPSVSSAFAAGNEELLVIVVRSK